MLHVYAVRFDVSENFDFFLDFGDFMQTSLSQFDL